MKKDWQLGKSRLRIGFKCMDEPNWDFGQNKEPNCIPLYPRLKNNVDSRSN